MVDGDRCVLVVGATGQLGSSVTRQLLDRGAAVRALVRPGSRHQHLAALGAGLVWGDLRDAASVRAAVQGADVVVATANVVVPRLAEDTFASVEEQGYRDLLDACTAAGVRKFVFPSVPVTPNDADAPQLRAKRATEAAILASGLDYAIFRLAPFTEVWLALAGGEFPTRGEQNATVDRPFGFLRTFRRMTGRMIDDRGVMLVNGSPDVRNAFISVADVARALVAAAVDDSFSRQTVELGGPEALSWRDVAAVLAAALGRPVRVRSTPVPVLRVLSHALRPFSPAAGELMQFNAVVAALPTEWDSTAVVARLGLAPLASVRDVVTAKLALPAAAAR